MLAWPFMQKLDLTYRHFMHSLFEQHVLIEIYKLKTSDGGESTPISLHQKDHIPEDCRDYKCKYCESIGSNDLLCQKFLLECDGCLFFYGVPDPPSRKYTGLK